MAVWRVPGGHDKQTRAVICLPKNRGKEEMRSTLAHCIQHNQEVVAVAGGRRAWHDAQQMLRRGEADVVVTVPGGPTGDRVEVAGEVQGQC